MKALCWHGKGRVQIDNVADPIIEEPTDAIIKVTRTAICGSDLHLLDGYQMGMESGDVLGHEFMGEVIEAGSAITRLKKGDRVVVPFNISCGACFFCEKNLFSCCDTTNRDAEKAEKLLGQAPGGLFGYSHLTGHYPGGQAEYVRVPHADVGPIKVPGSLSDDQVLFLSDIFPTGWMAAENANIEPGETVAIWGCGPVGQMTIQSCWLQGAGRVIAIDRVPERLEMARTMGRAEVLNFDDVDIHEALQQMTKGRGPDCCIDAVGAEAHGWGSFDAAYDKAKNLLGMPGVDRVHALRQAIYCCRKAGKLSVPGVYTGFPDKIPMGSLMNKGLTLKTGQTHTQKYMPMLLKMIEDGQIDPSFVITHRIPLTDAPEAYKTFRDKKDGCIKVVMTP